MWSGRRHLILTGGRGSGKSTLLRALLPLLSPIPIEGILTRAIPRQSVWMTETATGRECAIGQYDPSLPGEENKMRPMRDGFLTLGVSALHRMGEQASEWAMIDEIGYLESSCDEYLRAIETLMSQKRLIAVVRRQNLPCLEVLLRREDAYVIDLDAPFGTLGCVIMASGEGRRFGSNKLLADFGGEPMICRALAATEGIFAERVVVTRHREVAALCEERGIFVVLHDSPDRNDTVRLGLEAMSERVSGCMFCPADQPLLTHETVQTMAMAAAREERYILRLSDGECEGAPVIFPRRDFAELSALPQGKGGGVLMRRYPDRVVGMAVGVKSTELEDVDAVEDLRRMLDGL